MMEVASRLRTTHATVFYWLKKFGIPRRSWSDSAYVKLNPYGDPFAIPTRFSRRQRELLMAGILLHWAEGAKGRSRARLVNLDHRMLQIFLRFLREVCHIDENRLSLYVRVHQRFSLTAAQRHWVRLLRLPTAQVFVYPHTDQRSHVKKRWSPYGIATLEFHSTKLKQWLDRVTEQYIARQLSDRGGEVRDEAPMRYRLPWVTQENLTN